MHLLPKLPQAWATGVRLSPRSWLPGLMNLGSSEPITQHCNSFLSVVMILCRPGGGGFCHLRHFLMSSVSSPRHVVHRLIAPLKLISA